MPLMQLGEFTSLVDRIAHTTRSQINEVIMHVLNSYQQFLQVAAVGTPGAATNTMQIGQCMYRLHAVVIVAG